MACAISSRAEYNIRLAGIDGKGGCAKRGNKSWRRVILSAAKNLGGIPLPARFFAALRMTGVAMTGVAMTRVAKKICHLLHGLSKDYGLSKDAEKLEY
jgi:hypothetical protein